MSRFSLFSLKLGICALLTTLAPQEAFSAPACKVVTVDRSAEALRQQTMTVQGSLNPFQQKELTQMLVMVGIRRSKPERILQKTKSKLGLTSNDLIPIIPKGAAPTAMGDEARQKLQDYNEHVTLDDEPIKESYKRLMSDLFEIYLRRSYEPLNDSWFMVDGNPMSLIDFVRGEHFVQPEIKASNSWMNVVTLSPDKVQNLSHKGLTRELWWNRDGSINPVGTVRIARNLLTLPDGSQKTVSIEVLRRGDDGLFVPYYFEPDANGVLQPLPNTRGSIQRMESCFNCHLRLSGILFGGINMDGYKAVDDWHINGIDFTKREHYKKFKAFRN